MLAIRDDTGNRIREMAQSRVKVGRRRIPFQPTEMTWLTDAMRHDFIPPLDPQQYWKLIEDLLFDLISARARLAMDTMIEPPKYKVLFKHAETAKKREKVK